MVTLTAVYNASFNPRALFSLVGEILLELILSVKIPRYIWRKIIPSDLSIHHVFCQKCVDGISLWVDICGTLMHDFMFFCLFFLGIYKVFMNFSLLIYC